MPCIKPNLCNNFPAAGKRRYELHIHTDCDEPVRLIGWKYGEDNLRVREELDVLNQSITSVHRKLDRYYITLIMSTS